jgi:hypothetical protein
MATNATRRRWQISRLTCATPPYGWPVGERLDLTLRYGTTKSDDDMNENPDSQKSGISKADTPKEIGEFWDNHSLADYWAQTKEVVIDVRVQRARRTRVDPNLMIE